MKRTLALLLIWWSAMSAPAGDLALGPWHCAGPFKDEAFGNVLRSLDYRFDPELDYLAAHGVDASAEPSENLALSAVATSPDDRAPDGPHPPSDANDGSNSTYWDDTNGGSLYVLRLTWDAPVTFSAIELIGWGQHDFAPRSFELLADGESVLSVSNAVYLGNRYLAGFTEPAKACQLDLRITGYYGGSPGIREIRVMESAPTPRTPPVQVAVDLRKNYRMKPFPGYLDLERRWTARPDWTDGYYNLLPRGPAPSRNESVYLYRTITSDEEQSILMNTRMMDAWKIWLNGRLIGTSDLHLKRYPGVLRHLAPLQKGVNHLLIKNTSRWAEHGFSFGVEGLHPVKDPFYYNINQHELSAADGALEFISTFKFQPQPIPMYSPAHYTLDEMVDRNPLSPEAASYTAMLRQAGAETRALLAAVETGEKSPEEIMAHARKLEAMLRSEVRKLPPIVYIKRPLLQQNAIAPYDTSGISPSSICVYDPAAPEKGEQVIFHDPELKICDMSLSWDAKTIYFSAGQRNMSIFRINVDGTGLTRLTDESAADISPCELPDGRIAFISTRHGTFVVCQGRRSGLLYTMAPDGSDLRKLSANIDSDHTPRVTNDGRVMFSRWDYGVEKNVFARHALWTVNPDGTRMQLFFGNTIEDPAALWEARAIPGRQEVVCTFGPHHNGQAGMIGLVWPGNGPEQPRGEGYRWITREYPVWGDRTYHHGYRDAFPINEKQFLAAYGGTEDKAVAPMKLLLLDAFGNETVIRRDPDGLGCVNPLPLRPRRRPATIPPMAKTDPWKFVDPETTNRGNPDTEPVATLNIQDVYLGISEHVQRGEAKHLAVMEQVQKSRIMAGGEAWGHTPIIGRGTVHARRLIGLVPIEEDGSAHFTVPALRSISFNVLDQDGRTLMRMGSDMHVMPGERQSCIGCHEVRETQGMAPPSTSGRIATALRKPPVEPRMPDWGTNGLVDYIRVIQPIWDEHCIRCHQGPLAEGQVNMTGDKTRFFCQSYDHLVDREIVDHLNVFGLDHDENTPKTVGAMVSRIDEFLDESHCESRLSPEDRLAVYVWIDANVPYYGSFDHTRVDNNRVRGIGARDAWEIRYEKDADGNNVPATEKWADVLVQEFEQNCAQCHQREVFSQSWWPNPRTFNVYSKLWGDKAITSHVFPYRYMTSAKIGPELRINLTHPSHSLLLQAPLSREAGGYGSCLQDDGSPVFRDRDDPSYRNMLKAIHRGKERLEQFPRIDMLGVDAIAEDTSG